MAAHNPLLEELPTALQNLPLPAHHSPPEEKQVAIAERIPERLYHTLKKNKKLEEEGGKKNDSEAKKVPRNKEEAGTLENIY